MAFPNDNAHIQELGKYFDEHKNEFEGDYVMLYKQDDNIIKVFGSDPDILYNSKPKNAKCIINKLILEDQEIDNIQEFEMNRNACIKIIDENPKLKNVYLCISSQGKDIHTFNSQKEILKYIEDNNLIGKAFCRFSDSQIPLVATGGFFGGALVPRVTLSVRDINKQFFRNITFVVDTGCEITQITKEIADSLKLKCTGSTGTKTAANNVPVHNDIYQGIEIRISGKPIRIPIVNINPNSDLVLLGMNAMDQMYIIIRGTETVDLYHLLDWD